MNRRLFSILCSLLAALGLLYAVKPIFPALIAVYICHHFMTQKGFDLVDYALIFSWDCMISQP